MRIRLMRLVVLLFSLSQVFQVNTGINDIVSFQIEPQGKAKKESKLIRSQDNKYYKRYKILFDRFPDKYKSIILDYYRSKYPKKLDFRLKKDSKKYFSLDARRAVLEFYRGTSTENKRGYSFMLLPSLRGKREKQDLEVLTTFNNNLEKMKQLIDKSEEVLQGIKGVENLILTKKLIIEQNYKIHLMPKLDEIAEITFLLIEALVGDIELGDLIYKFKVKVDFDKIIREDGEVFPLIVIYPASGKDNAQKALDKIVELFKDRQGLDLTPRYNAKVTGFIYIAQGNGVDKKKENLQHYFEQPNMVYYKPDFTGEDKNYYLTFQGKDII